MATAQLPQPSPLLTFANLFKGYMGVMPVVIAILTPLLTAMNVIPTYEPTRKPLATIAGVLGFLLLSWLFYVRRTIALGSITRGWRVLFNVLPFALILFSIGCYIGYASALNASLSAFAAAHSGLTRAQALANGGQDYSVQYSVLLQLLYLGMFLFAEAAFVMMALREYANGVRHITEFDWMFGPQDGSTAKATFPAPVPLPTAPQIAAPQEVPAITP